MPSIWAQKMFPLAVLFLLRIAAGDLYRIYRVKNRAPRLCRGLPQPSFKSFDNFGGAYEHSECIATRVQYALLKTSLPAIAKGSLVFLGTLALSWFVTAALRRIPAIGRVI
jgi:hypothetical protein